MTYDHHKKSGNKGDCVKHVALIAALDTALSTFSPQPQPSENSPSFFHYLDVFAGHAWHPLLDEGKAIGIQENLEWVDGIGDLVSRHLTTLDSCKNKHVQLWRDSYLPRRPHLIRGLYPGSSVIASDMCKKHRINIRMTLFDRSDEALDDLRTFFQPVFPTDETRGDCCLLGRSLNPAKLSEADACAPDFVFIDPPNFDDLLKFKPFFDYLVKPRGSQGKDVLIWMPGDGQGPSNYPRVTIGEVRENAENLEAPHKRIQILIKNGFHWSAVGWGGGANAGCILLYNSAKEEIKAAVESIAKIGGWSFEHSGMDERFIRNQLRSFSATEDCNANTLRAINAVLGNTISAPTSSHSCDTVEDAIKCIRDELQRLPVCRFWPHAKDIPRGVGLGNFHAYIAYEDNGIRSFTIWPGLSQIEFFSENQTKELIQQTLTDVGHHRSGVPNIECLAPVYEASL